MTNIAKRTLHKLQAWNIRDKYRWAETFGPSNEIRTEGRGRKAPDRGHVDDVVDLTIWETQGGKIITGKPWAIILFYVIVFAIALVVGMVTV